MIKKILIIDDDETTRNLLFEIFDREGYVAKTSSSAEEALGILKNNEFNVVLSDIKMVGMNGIELLSHLAKINSTCVIILMTAFGSVETAIQSIKNGAFDYITKPFKISELKAVVERAFEQFNSLLTNKNLNSSIKFTGNHNGTVIGKSSVFVDVYKTVARASLSASNVLITGESGTGKELVARAIHSNSARKKEKFVVVNCAAIAESLLESELFGHVKGSFTGAINSKKGLFEEANNGTVFLDEIGDMSVTLQIKLLRLIQEGEYKPVGLNEIKRADVRIIAATHRNLEDMIKEGKFREDLYYRLRVISINIPPLRERPEDITDLVGHFIDKYSDKNKKEISHVSKDALDILLSYKWPGNVRELENAIERAVAMSKSMILYPEDFPPEIIGSVKNEIKVFQEGDSPKTNPKLTLDELEKVYILSVLKDVNYNKSRASEILGIDRVTLYRKVKRYGIDINSNKNY